MYMNKEICETFNLLSGTDKVYYLLITHPRSYKIHLLMGAYETGYIVLFAIIREKLFNPLFNVALHLRRIMEVK